MLSLPISCLNFHKFSLFITLVTTSTAVATMKAKRLLHKTAAKITLPTSPAGGAAGGADVSFGVAAAPPCPPVVTPLQGRN